MIHCLFDFEIDHWSLFVIRAFLDAFLQSKCLYFYSNCNEICSPGSKRQWVSIGRFREWMVLNRREAGWTNDDRHRNRRRWTTMSFCRMVEHVSEEMDATISSFGNAEFSKNFLNMWAWPYMRFTVYGIRFDTMVEVIAATLMTWEAHHSPLICFATGCGELPKSCGEATITEIEVSIPILSW